MKEFVSFDVFHYKSDCTNATQHCNNREPCDYYTVKQLKRKMKFGVSGLSSCSFQIC